MDHEKDISFTPFLFGNVDENGQLENDIFDAAKSRHLSTLGLFGLENFFLRDFMTDDEQDLVNFESSTKSDETNYLVKSASAEDFSKITELAEDPDLGVGKQISKASKEVLRSVSTVLDSEQERNSAMVESVEVNTIKKEETIKPLANVVPLKYLTVDVEELFPNFKPNKVLRFTRLFSSNNDGKSSRIWQKVRKRKKRKSETGDRSSSRVEVDRQSTITVNGEVWKMHYGTKPSEDQICSDDEVKLLKPVNTKSPENIIIEEPKPEIPLWRFGPAQYWYDMLGVPETGEGFDYGFKLADPIEPEEEPDFRNQFPDDAFLMVSQLRWENDVIWDVDDKKHKGLKDLYSSEWEPFRDQMKKLNVSQSVTTKTAVPQIPKGSKDLEKVDKIEEPWYSILPIENEDLVYGLWEEDVIWDAQNMKRIPTPRVFALDLNDENIVFEIPDDTKSNRPSVPEPKIKVLNPHLKKSKQLLGKVGVINILEEETPAPIVKTALKDPFNISNDEYYMPKTSPTSSKRKPMANLIQHSIPALELQPQLMPTNLSPTRLKHFHRPPLKSYSRGLLAVNTNHPVQSLSYHIKQKAKDREKERIASGGGNVFYMRTIEDLSGRDGELILVEFSEEHPPLMNQVGMCSKIKNYYKRKVNDKGAPQYNYGETAYVHKSPFLGMLSSGQSLQALENNMYRAPIYNHDVPLTDFVVIRTKNQYYIRAMDALFLAGQECPLMEVPVPNSKRCINFLRDFLKLHICRLFCKSNHVPPAVKMDDIKKLFPYFSETTIRKRLNAMAEFKRAGIHSNLWVLKLDFRMPSEEELREMVRPETYCAFVSMKAGEQRLKDAGYEKSGFAAEDNENEDSKAEDEILAAPWSTTRAYIQATEGRCLLQLVGPADPTGCGEGFSYVKTSQKPNMQKDNEGCQKKSVTGTDADLRKLTLKEAKEFLRKYGLPEEEIKKLSRWEVIAVVRTLSTEKAKAGEETMSKFSRRNKFSIAEIAERYKEECQRIFDLQNHVLASSEVLSTDEGESSSENEENDMDFEEMGKNIEKFLLNKKIPRNLTMELEEQERKKLQKMVMGEDESSSQSHSNEQKIKPKKKPGRVLKIYRTFIDERENKQYTRVETVRNQAVIDEYLKAKNTNNSAVIKDEDQQEMYRKEKRRIQDQLRRIKRREAKMDCESKNSRQKTSAENDRNPAVPSTSELNVPIKSEYSTPKKVKQNLKVKCGACGNLGHMRTNRSCPAFTSFGLDENDESSVKQEPSLINVEGTKLILSSKLIKQAEKYKQETYSPPYSDYRETSSSNKRKRKISENDCEYLKVQSKSVKRRMTDPVIVISSIFEEILNEMRDLPGVELFRLPVNTRRVPDYRQIVKTPMDLQSMREKLRHNSYQRREDFLADVNQIVNNSAMYNGSHHPLTEAAQTMLNLCVKRFEEKEIKLMKLEKAINPLLDDDDLVAFSYILSSIVEEKMKNYHDIAYFSKPVNKKKTDYYAVVQFPMDVETIEKKVKAHQYHSCEEFLNDVKLISTNAALYYGQESSFHKSAEGLYGLCRESISEYYSYLSGLEEKISSTRQKISSDVMYSENTRSSFASGAESNFLPNSATEPENSNASYLSFDDCNDGFIESLQISEESNSKASSDLVREKVNVLEQDLQFSSEDELDNVPCKSEEPTQMQTDEDTGNLYSLVDEMHQNSTDILQADFSDAYNQYDDQIANQGTSSDIKFDNQSLTFNIAKSLIPEMNQNNTVENHDKLSLFGSDRESVNNSTPAQVGTPYENMEEEFGDLWF